MAGISPKVLAAFVAVASLHADTKKLSYDQRVELLRGLTAEFATVKAILPRSKKPLPFESTGEWNRKQWEEIARREGLAAKAGDTVKVTKVAIGDKTITLQINDGMQKKGSFWDRVTFDLGGVSQTNDKPVPDEYNGTSLVIRFKESLGEITSTQVKKLLSPVLDFEKHSVTEQYAETVPPEIRQAIKDQKPIAGMDRDQVVLAMGIPVKKTRETKDEVEYEDWQYGQPPGRVVWVRFTAGKVVGVKEDYATLNGNVAVLPPPPQ